MWGQRSGLDESTWVAPNRKWPKPPGSRWPRGGSSRPRGRDRYQDLTVSGVIKSLGWTLDAFDRLLAGEVPARALLEPDPVDDAPSDAVPAGLARTWKELRPSERDRVQGYIDGLFASRTH